MYVIDINTHFGCRSEYHYDLGLPALLRSLDEHAIAGAVTYSLKGTTTPAPAARYHRSCAAHPHLIRRRRWTCASTWDGSRNWALPEGRGACVPVPPDSGWEVDSILFRRVLEHCAGKVVLIFSATEAGALGPCRRGSEDHGRVRPAGDPHRQYFNMAELIGVCGAYVYPR